MTPFVVALVVIAVLVVLVATLLALGSWLGGALQLAQHESINALTEFRAGRGESYRVGDILQSAKTGEWVQVVSLRGSVVVVARGLRFGEFSRSAPLDKIGPFRVIGNQGDR